MGGERRSGREERREVKHGDCCTRMLIDCGGQKREGWGRLLYFFPFRERLFFFFLQASQILCVSNISLSSGCVWRRDRERERKFRGYHTAVTVIGC